MNVVPELTNIGMESRVCERMSGEAMGVALAEERVEDSQDTRLSGLFDSHHERLYKLARRLSSTADDALDLVQETFLRVVRAPASVPSGRSNEEAWLVRILINICRDQWRKRASRRRFDARYPSEVRTVATASAEATLIAHTSIWRALEALPPRRRAAVVLRELEDIDFPEIARLLGISPITARWHVSRGRQELARLIKCQERDTS
jgi:RNA polymerase sigma-70 factor (ECF subfamily)